MTIGDNTSILHNLTTTMRITKFVYIGLLAPAPQASCFLVPASFIRRDAIRSLCVRTTEQEAAVEDEFVDLWNKQNAVDIHPSLCYLSSALPLFMETKLSGEENYCV